MFKSFAKEVYYSVHPKKLNEITEGSALNSVGYFTKVLMVSFIIMCLLYAPQIGKLPDFVGSQVEKFDTLKISGTVQMAQPISIPEKSPYIKIDMTGAEVIPDKEKLIVTKNYLYYNLLTGPKTVEMKKLLDASENKDLVSNVIAIFTVIILPSIIFFAFLVLWIKFFLIIIASGTILYFLLDLTHYRKGWKKMMQIACHASTVPVFIELVSVPVSTKWLMPVFSIWGISFYMIPIILLLGIGSAITILVHYFGK